ncbi:MAG: winged helix-turn-helix domain-containing protein [Xanthomonadales bacterium]|nr:winged helix-turn-helix domain-containing protein [Xanthomonadales bacterium]
MLQSEPGDFRLGDWTVRPQRCCLERGDQQVRVKPKSMTVLVVLAGARGEVVSRQDLFETVWHGGIVSEDTLAQCVVELRRALGDSAREARFIETIPRVGFRLVTPVTPLARAAERRIGVSWPGLALVLAVLLGTAVLAYRGQAPAPGPLDGSVAVLPFADLSPDGDQDYLADGLSEELINRLTRIQGLQVTGRTSAFYFKNRDRDPRQIGQQLRVGHLLDGSVRKSGNQLRITARLTNVQNGFQVWSKTFDRPLQNVFAVQEEIAEAVALALSVKLSVGKLGRMQGGTANVDAWEAVMKGNAMYREFSADSLAQATGYFERAVTIDPGFAVAWAQLSDVYRNTEWVLGPSPRRQQQAEQALGRALDLAPDSTHVLRSAAYMHMTLGEWEQVERKLGRIHALDPDSDAKTTGVTTDFLFKVGRADEASAIVERVRRLDPLHPGTTMFAGHLLAMQGQVQAALDELERGYAMGGYLPPLSVEGLVVALSTGDPALVRRWLKRAVTHEQPGARGVHTAMAQLIERPADALAWLRQGFEDSTIPDYYTMVWAGYLDDPELALQAMRRTPDLWGIWLPVSAQARQLPGFRQLMQDLGLVSYWREFGWGRFCRPIAADEFECG